MEPKGSLPHSQGLPHLYYVTSHLIWSQIIKDRRVWNDLVQKTKTHVGL